MHTELQIKQFSCAKIKIQRQQQIEKAKQILCHFSCQSYGHAVCFQSQKPIKRCDMN